MAGTITVLRGNFCNVYLIITDESLDPQDMQTATVTFTVATTSISKTTADWTIFPAHPLYELHYPEEYGSYVDDAYDPCFIIRIFPADIATLSGNYTYTLSITDGSTENYYGDFVVGGVNIYPRIINRSG